MEQRKAELLNAGADIPAFMGGRDVQTVIIAGRVVMKNRSLPTVDLGPMRERVKKQHANIMERIERRIE